VRETVTAVERLVGDEDGDAVTMVKVGRELKLDKNPTYQRVQRAIEGGYLKNLEDHKGRPARLVLGDPMPEDRPILPAPELLKGFTISGDFEGIHHPPPPSATEERERFTI